MWHISDLLNYAKQCMNKNRLETSIDVIQFVLEKYPQSDHARGLLAEVLLEQKRLREAYISVSQAIELRPNDLNYQNLQHKIISELSAIGEILETSNDINDIYAHGDDEQCLVDLSKYPISLPHRKRSPVLNQTSRALGLMEADYLDGINRFIRKHARPDDLFSIYATTDEALPMMRKIKNTAIGKRIEYLVLDEQHWKREYAIDCHQIQRVSETKSRYLFVHLGSDQSIQTVIQYLILNTKIGTIEGGIFQDAEIVYLNRTGPIDSTNPNSLVFIGATNSGRDRFLPGLLFMAAKRGRKIKQHHLFINSPARRDRLMQERAKLKGASTNAHLKENSDTMLRYGKEFIENLDFFEVGVMHQPFPIKEVEKTSYLDCIALMRDPRDAATSYGFSSSWPRPNPSMDDWETAGKFEFQNNVNFFIDNYLEPLSDHFVEVQKSESCFVVRFEDLHEDAFGVYARLFKWLGWSGDLKADEISQAIYLGTFNYQSGGSQRRDQNDGTEFGIHGDLRRGTVGNWQKFMTPKMKRRFKEKAAGQLIKLGYAENCNW